MRLTDQDRDQLAARVTADAFLEASAAQWERRAATFEWARPRPGDYNGRATLLELVERSERLTEAARACRARATLADTTRADLADTCKALGAVA